MSKAKLALAKQSAEETTEKQKRINVSQADVPSITLVQALRVARAINDNYGGAPTKPLRVAEALNMSTASGSFRTICGASIAYGLTEGGYNAAQISLTPLGRRIVAPTEEGNDQLAMRAACLIPRIIKNFLTRYNNHKLPPDNIARNVLQEMDVPQDKTQRTLSVILDNAKQVGFLREIKGQLHVDLDGNEVIPGVNVQADADHFGTGDDSTEPPAENALIDIPVPSNGAVDTVQLTTQSSVPQVENSRVFITHGKNKEIVAQLKELLTFGKFEPIVSVERETVSKPVTDKVMDDMRLCYAAIIHVGKEMKVMDTEGQEHIILNSNVLIEIGAAMALYGRRFILLVEKGVTLPSNLQGLYEVRYEGDRLDYEATMRLLKAFNDFKP